MMLHNTRLTRMLASMLAVALLAAPAWDAWADGRRGGGERNRGPVIDRDTEVTSRDQIGVLKNNFLILCPNDTKEIDLTAKVSGRFRAQATSSDPQVARAGTRKNARNHWLLETVAGPNNTDQDKFATVTVNITKDVINLGFPPPDQPRRGRVIENPPLGTRDLRDQMTVRVLAARKCAALPPEQPRQANRIGREGRAARPASGRNLKICTESARRFDVDRMIRLTYPQRTKTIRNQQAPPIRSLTEKSNTNPNAVEVGIYGQYNDNGQLAPAPLQLVFMGWEKGEATIVIEESHPLPQDTIPWKETWHVKVEDCDEQVRRAQFHRAFLPADYQLFRPVQRERSWLDDELEELEREIGRLDAPTEEKYALTGPEGREAITENFETVVKAGLVTMTTIVDDTNISIHCPSEAQGGDMISCSVISDDPEKVNPNDYVVQMESVTTISEESRDMKKAMFTAMLPAGIGSAIMVMKDKTGKEIGKGELPVKPTDTIGQPPAEVMFPRQTALGEPMMFKGSFTEPLSETAVTVDGQQASILARSPSSLVVENPAVTEGPKQISVQTGEKTVTGPVQMFSPQSVARHLEVPQELPAPDEALPVEQEELYAHAPATAAMNEACQQQVELYKAQLRSRVDSQWSPPKPPSRGTWTTVLGYNLMPDLSVRDVKVVKPSGYSPVDQSAVQRVYQLDGQFSPLPTCYDKPYLPIEHTFKLIYR